jgi:hypothetical protein
LLSAFSQLLLECPKAGSIVDVQEGMGIYVQLLSRHNIHLEAPRFQNIENAQHASSELIAEDPPTLPGVDAAKWLDPTLLIGGNDDVKSSLQAPQPAEQFGWKKRHVAAKETVVLMV